MRARSHTALILLGTISHVDTLPDTPFPQWFIQVTRTRSRVRAHGPHRKLEVERLGKRLSEVVSSPTVANWHRFVHLHRALKSK